MRKTLVCSTLICAMYSCNVKSQENNFVKPVVVSNSNDNKKIECSDTISYKNWYIQVKNTKVDSIESEPGNKLWYKYPMIRQDLLLYKDGDLVKSILIPGQTVKLKLENGKFIDVKEQLTFLIGVIEGEKETVFYLESFAGCNSCESSVVILSLSGEIKVVQYLDSNKKHKDEKGTYPSEMQRIGFDIQKFEKGDFRKNSLFCDDTFELFLGL